MQLNLITLNPIFTLFFTAILIQFKPSNLYKSKPSRLKPHLIKNITRHHSKPANAPNPPSTEPPSTLTIKALAMISGNQTQIIDLPSLFLSFCFLCSVLSLFHPHTSKFPLFCQISETQTPNFRNIETLVQQPQISEIQKPPSSSKSLTPFQCHRIQPRSLSP